MHSWLRFGWLFVFTTAVVYAVEKVEKEEGFVPLFNGKDLTGWKQVGGKEGVWTVKDGLLVCQSGGGGWLSTAQTYADFVLRLEYRLPPGGNSGIFIRAPREGNPWITGMEIQLLDDAHPKHKNLKPFQYTGSIYGVVPPTKRVTKPGGQWNQIEITARGRKITVAVNGTTVVDANLGDYRSAEKERPGLARKDGYIGLQSYDGLVEFRNLRLQPLKPEK